MTLTIMNVRSESGPMAEKYDDGFASAWNEIVFDFKMSSQKALSDPLEHRLGVLASLRPGWDGPGSLAPSRAALSTLYSAALRLADRRPEIGASPHADGYINVESQIGSTWLTARIWADRMDLMTDDEDNDLFEHRVVPLDASALLAFLRPYDVSAAF